MPDYQKGKIYKIINDVNEMTYYGSTVQPLSVRMGKHRNHYKCKISKTYNKFGDIKDCKIFLVENYPCENKEQLQKRERYYIENYPCVNKAIPGNYISKTKREYNNEYYSYNIQSIAEQKKQYHLDNQQSINEKKRQYHLVNKDKINKKYNCTCGGKFTHTSRARHLKTKKHLKI